MTQPDNALAPLRAELDLWAAEGRRARLWLRDDDATIPTPALDRLIGLAGRYGVPVTLAVIPEPTDAALAARLADAPDVEVTVHGWAHRNHAPNGRKTCEFGPDRPADAVLSELAGGIAKLSRLHGPRLVPVLVPPWNRIAPDLIPRLPGLGFQGLSVFGPEPAGAAVAHVNCHVDLIDWRGTRGGRAVAALADDLIARLAALRAGDLPKHGAAGVLSHHLDHDDAAWQGLEAIFRATRHPGAVWVPLSQALARRRSSPPVR
jgi:peptidoglycan/xylan/chitin deacetylase (PgdA/CDA1 family)